MLKRVHMMGIGGSGMSGVAYLASKMGYSVTGCDLEGSTAYAKNIFKGHSPDHLKDVDLLVVSPAIYFQNKDNPELLEGEKKGIVVTWEKFLGEYLVKNKKVICVAGTHGKSTTTAMVGQLLIDAGLDPSVLVGASVPEWGGNAMFGEGEYFVIEADEFNNNFLNYHPDIAIINNIEFDHPDFFKNEEEVRESFKKFIGNLKGEKILITEKGSPNKHFNLKLIGEHNQKNANMVYVLGRKLGIGQSVITKSLEKFEGIGRRMELILDLNGIKVFDDYAHHPTAIKTTIEGLRGKYPTSRIIVVNEPHGFARTKALLEDYRGVFDSSDKVLIGPIFKARDVKTFNMTPQIVAQKSEHKDATGYDSFEEIKKVLSSEIKKGDVIIVMGAGKSYLWAKEIAKIGNTQKKQSSKIKIIEDKYFRDLTTFHTGGKIKYFVEVASQEEIAEAINFAKAQKLKVFVIGGGSDLLVSDIDFDGLVIKYVGSKYLIKDDVVTAEGGMLWDQLVEISVENNLWGLECLSGIPGTVGASPIQNIGAYGHELSETFVGLVAYDLDKDKFVTFDKDDCKFGYRESIFKDEKYWQKYLITSVTFKLSKTQKTGVGYDSLKDLVSDDSSLVEIRNAVLKTRGLKLENPLEFGNAGSFFKNPIIDASKKDELLEKYPDARIYPFKDKFKVFAGWLIENTGWKGINYENAGVSKKHALILINRTGKATSKEVFDLSKKIIESVERKFGISLEREVQLINF